MGLFDKKFCDICGDKVNLLTQKKLSDGQLCSDCKQKLGSFTSGWKQRTVQNVKAHLEQREQNKQKYQQFNCTAAAGGRNSTLQADFNHRWFIFAVDNRDFRSGNPQVFEFSKLQDFWIEPEYRTLNDSDNDGIPDNRDDFDNRQLNNQDGFGGNMNRMNNMMNTSMLNIPLAAQPFVRNSSSCSSPNEIREVSNIRVCFRVTDLYITNPIGFDVTSGISSGNQMELMNAYETAVQVMQLCRQIKQDGASVNQGYSQMNQSYGQPQQHPLRFKTTPIIMLHPLHRKQLTLLGFAHPAAHVTKANSAKAAAVQSLQQCLHAARAVDGLRQTVSLCRNSAPNVEHACNLKRADCIKKASLFLLMLLLPIGLFGCGAKKKYTAADVSVISFSCSSMSYTDSYAYSLKKENEEWLFDANYSYDYENPRVEFENKKVSAQDAAAILDVVKEQGLILQAQKYKPPRIKAFVLDDGGYFLYFKMNDGTEINAEIYNEDLVNELRTLTEKCRKS